MRWPPASVEPLLVDPCAGTGEAIACLRSLWAESYGAGPGRPSWRPPFRPRVVACELEAERFAALEGVLLGERDEVFHGDAFQLAPAGALRQGVTVLWLNPPYDTDREHGRLEHRFLVRFAPHLAPDGLLLFLVPCYALAASAAYLASHCNEIRCWRLPEPEWQGFRQVLLVARSASVPVAGEFTRRKIERWAAHPEELPVLAESCPDPYEVRLEGVEPRGFDYGLADLDLAAAICGARPFAGAAAGLDQPVEDLLGARFETAMPPKPAHIALALASGMFNGRTLYPNDPKRHPALLAKGAFERRFVPVSERRNRKGEKTGTVEIELPELRLTVLRLDTGGFHTLAAGTEPTGSPDLARWNVADLIAHYDRSLTEVLAGQFPALHDPTKRGEQIALPVLARRPFRIQDQAVQAMLKLLARGRTPFLIGEVGTGKTTMALLAAAALSPAYHAETSEQLARLGFTSSLPTVVRTLVFCPPHLLESWTEQIHAVLPMARVVILKRPSDLEKEGDFFLLSREAAKLGPAIEGVEGRCPGCFAPLETSAEQNADRRLRCGATIRRPGNGFASLAEGLAVVLAPAFPTSAAATFVRGALRSRLSAERPRSLSQRALEALLAHLRFEEARLEARSGARAHRDEDRRELLAVQASLEAAVAMGASSEQHAAIQQLFPRLLALGRWESRVCGEPLFFAGSRPRRYPLSKRILARHRRKFSLLVIDEAHEANHGDSAQSIAAHRLARLPGVPTLVLTGSLMGGYASDLFTNLWSFSRRFRRELERQEVGLFVERYGFRKLLREEKESDSPSRRGRSSDRRLDGCKVIGEAPGILPTFITRHLLPHAVFVHKCDLDRELPACRELPQALGFEAAEPLDLALQAEYRQLQKKLLDQIKRDRFTPLDGRLFGALGQLPSYLDRATDDLPPFVLAYPQAVGGELVAEANPLPALYRTPKERWLAGKLRECREAGEKVLLFVSHTGTGGLPSRLRELVAEVTPGAVFLDAKKVPAAERESWIRRHVVEKEAPVLLVNPNAVKTGLNCLVTFSTAIWYELDLSALTYRQANGRLHRIGQTRPVTIHVPFYAGTAQQIAFELVAQKVSASLKVDGLDLTAALEAAGAGTDAAAAVASVMGLGQAIYQRLTKGA